MKTNVANSRTIGEKVLYTVLIVVFSLYSVSLLFPLFWAILVSLKTHEEYMINSPFALPEQWVFKNYLTAFSTLEVNGATFPGMIVNSLWYAVGSCVLNIFVCSMTAYIFARYEFKGSRVIYNVLLIIMLMPIIGNGPAIYRVYSRLHITNSPFFLISTAGGIGINFLYQEAFYRNVSWSYAEAAFIDGANHWTVFFRIMMPQTLGIVSTLGIMQFIQYWNDYSTPMLYFPELPTLALGLYQYEIKMIRGANMPVYFAGLVLSMLPVLIIFAFCQNSIMEREALGGIKG